MRLAILFLFNEKNIFSQQEKGTGLAKWENSRPMECGRYKSCLSKDILGTLL
jgi:hypothetical protein